MLKKAVIFWTLTFSQFAASADAQELAPKFPFPAQVDEQSGKTGNLPNRVRDQKTGLWFVLVPAGKYRIGSDRHFDSKPIDVTLSAFYLCETRLSNAVAAPILEKAFRDNDDLMKGYVPLESKAFADLVAGKSKWLGNTPPEEGDDVVIMMLNLQDVSFGGLLGDGDPLFPMPEEIKKRFEQAIFGNTLEGGIADDGDSTKKLRMSLRKVSADYERAFDDWIALLKRDGASDFKPASFKHANLLAEKMGLRLPTESQWEVAARLCEANKLQVPNLFDGTREFCSDLYAHDYFHRQQVFENPTGPTRAKVTLQQFPAADSSIGIFRALTVRRFHVVRGGDVSTRAFGYWGKENGLRVAFQP
jgi:hypothetical protein